MTEAGWTAERKLVEELLTFIEATSGRKLKFSTIANLKTGETEDPQHRIAAWLKRHLDADRQQGRVAGLVRGAQLVRWHKSCAFEADPALALERAAKDIESVASQIIHPQQAQDEKGVGNANIKMS